jgi:uroporphyrin-III C-methyltransferase
MNKLGTVYLVGSGPGAVDLLTLKAFRLIQSADVIVYDRLVSPEIELLFPVNAKKHYVGKQESEHTLPQEEINQLLVDYAKKYNNVVRLKGGDPFVFGRGGEEIELLLKNNISYEVVPGISSSISAATYAGIPVTHRGVSTNFTVIAGHTCLPQSFDSLDWNSFSHLGTLVILMGIRSRATIAENLIKVGKYENTPIAFIENATTPRQRVIISTLAEVSKNKVEVRSPAVMVIGEVVNFHHEWNWFNVFKDDFSLNSEAQVGL